MGRQIIINHLIGLLSRLGEALEHDTPYWRPARRHYEHTLMRETLRRLRISNKKMIQPFLLYKAANHHRQTNIRCKIYRVSRIRLDHS